MQGKISIVRQYDNTRDTPRIHIFITDEASHTQFLEVLIEPEIFGLLVCGESYKDCEFELYAEHVGKKHEFKREQLPLPDEYFTFRKSTDNKVSDYLSQFETDGWIASKYDFMNSNRINHQKNTIDVGFDRYV